MIGLVEWNICLRSEVVVLAGLSLSVNSETRRRRRCVKDDS
jgi:hypothetical protein